MRVLVWWGAGNASSVAAKKAREKYGPKVEVLYCDTSASEHPDNIRFRKDINTWLGGEPIKVLRSEDFKDIWEVFEKRRWLRSAEGAPCTAEMKIAVRHAYQQAGDLQIFGFTSDEEARWTRFLKTFPDVQGEWLLGGLGITKMDCHGIIQQAGIEMPMMYKLGYPNNNCCGCVKAESVPYWTHIRKDFPENFQRMALLERKFNFALNRKGSGKSRTPLFLDEIPQGVRKMRKGLTWECGVLCQTK